MLAEQLKLQIPSAREMKLCWFEIPAETESVLEEIDNSPLLQRGQDISLGYVRLMRQRSLGMFLSKNIPANRSLLSALQSVLLGERAITQVIQYVYVQGYGWTRAKDAGEHVASYSLIQLVRSAFNARHREARIPYSAFSRVIFRENVLFEAFNLLDRSHEEYQEALRAVEGLKNVVKIYYQKYDRLLYKVIKTVMPYPNEIKDLADELRHVLFNAAYRYAPEVGVGFTYHATLWIRAALYDLINKRCRNDELFCSTSCDDVYEKSLNVTDAGNNSCEHIESDELQNELSEILRSILSDREFDIVCRRFGLIGKPQTFVEIAKIYSVSNERARQIFNAAIKKVSNSDMVEILKHYLS